MLRYRLGGIVGALLVCSLATNCGPMPESDIEPSTDASSLTVFDLHPDEMERLSALATAGDADAAFRLANFYSMAGGEGDPNVNDAHDQAQERRWLKLAAQQGHRVAKRNLAFNLTKDDCPKARRLMNEIAQSAESPNELREAESLLRDPKFTCEP